MAKSNSKNWDTGKLLSIAEKARSTYKHMTLVYIGDALLPVPPERITYKPKNQNKAYRLINGEEINQVLPPGLMEITMEKVLLPNEAYSFCAKGADGKILSAAFFIELFATLKREKRTFQLVINGSSDGLCNDGNSEAGLYTLESYSVVRSVDLNDDYEATLTFKEYVDFGIKSVAIQLAGADLGDAISAATQYISKKKTRKSTKNETEEQTYTVKSGDTLWAISKTFYGDGSLYPYLVSLNNIKNANSLKVGQVLKIGPKADAEAYCKNNKSSNSSSGSSKNKTTSSKLTASTKVAITNTTGKIVGSGTAGALNKFEAAIQENMGKDFYVAGTSDLKNTTETIKNLLKEDENTGNTPDLSKEAQQTFVDYAEADQFGGHPFGPNYKPVSKYGRG